VAKGRSGGPAAAARRAADFFLLAEERPVTSAGGRAADAALGVVAAIAGVVAVFVQARHSGGAVGSLIARPGFPQGIVFLPDHAAWPSAELLVGTVLTTAPLAFRRIYPTAVFCVILAAVFATSGNTTSITFVSVIFAAYSAVTYSRLPRLAVLTVLAGALIVTAAYPDTTPPLPARYTALLILAVTVAVGNAIRVWRQRAGESAKRLRLAQQQHEEQTLRAVALERARIASELHDVVTHNVSVMVVQAGAARRVLDTSPGDAREALLAVEASGRTAMTELRHLLGLLAPSGEAGAGEGDAELSPQPGLGQIPVLLDRVRAAGLPVELSVEAPARAFRALPPGPDLAAYRVVQEALTNVMKHAGQVRTAVRLEYRPRDLLVTVSDDGRLAWAAPAPQPPGPPPGPAPRPAGRGLIGLRERIAVYGGELDAGPRPSGGWRLAARIPLDPLSTGDDRPGPDMPVPPEYQASPP
jgi:signal transduction histidine kinase